MVKSALKKILAAFNKLVPVHRVNPLVKIYAIFWQPKWVVVRKPVEINCDQALKNVPDFLIGTTRGAYLVSGGKAERLLPHYVYGITQKDEQRWIFAQTHPYFDFARLVEVNIETGDAKTLVPYMGKRAHQIDIIDHKIYVTDTYRNAVLRFDLDGKHIDTHHPFGDIAAKGRESENYRHMNSVYSAGKEIYVFCHNETRKTGNKSEIATFDMNMGFLRSQKQSATNGHNVIKTNRGFLYCDSLGDNSLNCDDQILVKTKQNLTRGLAINEKNLLLGASVITSRENRGKGHCTIYCYDYALHLLGKIEMPNTGNLYEIRFLENDTSLSNNAQHAADLHLGKNQND